MVKRFNNVLSQESQFLHNPFVPAEIRQSDPVQARVSIDKGKTWSSERVWRYSPFGVELLDSGKKLPNGQSLDLELTIGGDTTLFSGVVAGNHFVDQSLDLVGIRLFTRSSSTDYDAERRTGLRWRCSESFLPTGTAANPARFNDFIFFRVEDISISGMRIVTSMRNKLLMKGQRLETTISLPCVGAVQCNFEIKRIDYATYSDKEFMVLGVEFLRRDNILIKLLAEYLLQFGEGVTGQSLLKDGFLLNNAYRKFDFSYVKTEDEYKQVLELRLEAYKAAGKLKPGVTAQDMADEFDARSRILIVKHSDKIVGSVRVIFHEDSDKLSYGRYFDVPPEGLPPRQEYAEASRMCTDQSYRGADIAFHLIEHMVLTTVQSGRKYILSGATGSLIGLWERCGFKRLGIQYASKDLAGIVHELILMNTHDVALGRGISLGLWNRVFGRMVVYMLENRMVTPTPLDLMRINLYRVISRLGFSRSVAN
jgi:predicted GNAT family N-acyltransferase